MQIPQGAIAVNVLAGMNCLLIENPGWVSPLVTLVIVIAVCRRSLVFWGPKNMHTYPDIFESATISLQIRLPSIRIR